MKVLRDGKEIKNAQVSYFAGGQPDVVTVDGVTYAASAFTFEDDTTQKKTKDVKDAGVLTTKTFKRKK